jgi:hypothetical protein
MKQLVANNLQKLIKKDYHKRNKTRYSQKEHTEWRTIKNIKQKLINNHSMIAKADKGNTLIIFIKPNDINESI